MEGERGKTVGERGPEAGFGDGGDGPEGEGEDPGEGEFGGEGAEREHGHDEVAVPGILAEDLDAEQFGDEAEGEDVDEAAVCFEGCLRGGWLSGFLVWRVWSYAVEDEGDDGEPGESEQEDGEAEMEIVTGGEFDEEDEV